MKNLLRHSIARALRESGFDSFEEKAMHYFINILELYTQKILSGIKNNSCHCGRSRTTLLDLTTKLSFKEVKSFPYLEYEPEIEVKTLNYISPVSAPVEKFMHIYEFMPIFPPLHTFKETIIREKKVRSRARDVKDRIEQRNKVIESLFSLIRASKKKPKCVNYLNQE